MKEIFDKAKRESHRPELFSRTIAFGSRIGRFLALSWTNYDDAYKLWKRHKIIYDQYGVRLFFLLYPLYKILKPFIKLFGRKPIGRPFIRTLDPSKKTMLLVSHEAS